MTYFHAILQWLLFCAVLAAIIWLIWLALEQSTGKEKRSRSSIFKGLILGAVTGTCIGLGGFFLADAPATRGMGEVMFLLVPFCAGFAISMVTRGRNTAWACSLLAVLVSLIFLVAGKFEGLLCAIMAFPLLALGMGFGVLLGYLFRRHVLEHLRHQITSMVAVFVLSPMLVLAGHQLERPSLEKLRRETIFSSILLTAQPQQVWTSIQSIDSINVRKPLLMYFGLPVPLRCTLEKPSVGAKRTCYFENGFIEETITKWDPPYSMQLTIDRTNMPGRHWLGFETAAYDLRPEEDGTRLTRTTTITSHLYPVWYWRSLERLGVASEHDYIMRDLASRLRR